MSTMPRDQDYVPLDDEAGDASSPVMIAFMLSFFFVWNIGLSLRIVVACIALYRGDLIQGMVDLCCPLWMAGIIVPLWIGYTQSGLLAMLIALVVCVFVPYSVSIYRIAVLGIDATYQEGPGRQTCLGRLLGFPSIPQEQEGSGTNVDYQELLVIKKAKSRECDSTEKEEPKSYKDNHPKSDILLPTTELCGICLEEYKEGDEVAWSKSPNCFHAFHADCLVDWLKSKDEERQVCPVCRESYHPKSPESAGSAILSSPSYETEMTTLTDEHHGDLELGVSVEQESDDGQDTVSPSQSSAPMSQAELGTIGTTTSNQESTAHDL